MALPSVRNVAAVASGQGDITPALPTYSENDILVLVVHSTNRSFNTDPPSGWSTAANLPAGLGTADAVGAVKLHVYWKRAGASESAPTLDSANTGGAQVGRIMSVQGCITTGDPWDVTANFTQSSASTSLSFPSVTTTGTDRLIVLAAAFDRDAGTTANLPALTNANLANITEQMDNLITTNAGGGIGCATGEKASTGSTGTTTGTITSSIFLSWTGALKPASSTQYTETHTFTGTGTATLTRVASYARTGTMTGSGATSLARVASYLRTGTMTGTGAPTFSKQLSAIRSFAYSGTGTPTFAKGLLYTVIKTFTGQGTAALTYGLVSLIQRTFGGTGTVTYSDTVQYGLSKAFTGTGAVALVRRIGKVLSASGVGTAVRAVQVRLLKQFTGTGATARTHAYSSSRSGTMSGVGTVTSQRSFISGAVGGVVIRFRRAMFRLMGRR